MDLQNTTSTATSAFTSTTFFLQQQIQIAKGTRGRACENIIDKVISLQ